MRRESEIKNILKIYEEKRIEIPEHSKLRIINILSKEYPDYIEDFKYITDRGIASIEIINDIIDFKEELSFLIYFRIIDKLGLVSSELKEAINHCKAPEIFMSAFRHLYSEGLFDEMKEAMIFNKKNPGFSYAALTMDTKKYPKESLKIKEILQNLCDSDNIAIESIKDNELLTTKTLYSSYASGSEGIQDFAINLSAICSLDLLTENIKKSIINSKNPAIFVRVFLNICLADFFNNEEMKEAIINSKNPEMFIGTLAHLHSEELFGKEIILTEVSSEELPGKETLESIIDSKNSFDLSELPQDHKPGLWKRFLNWFKGLFTGGVLNKFRQGSNQSHPDDDIIETILTSREPSYLKDFKYTTNRGIGSIKIRSSIKTRKEGLSFLNNFKLLDSLGLVSKDLEIAIKDCEYPVIFINALHHLHLEGLFDEMKKSMVNYKNNPGFSYAVLTLDTKKQPKETLKIKEMLLKSSGIGKAIDFIKDKELLTTKTLYSAYTSGSEGIQDFAINLSTICSLDLLTENIKKSIINSKNPAIFVRVFSEFCIKKFSNEGLKLCLEKLFNEELKKAIINSKDPEILIEVLAYLYSQGFFLKHANILAEVSPEELPNKKPLESIIEWKSFLNWLKGLFTGDVLNKLSQDLSQGFPDMGFTSDEETRSLSTSSTRSISEQRRNSEPGLFKPSFFTKNLTSPKGVNHSDHVATRPRSGTF